MEKILSSNWDLKIAGAEIIASSLLFFLVLTSFFLLKIVNKDKLSFVSSWPIYSTCGFVSLYLSMSLNPEAAFMTPISLIMYVVIYQKYNAIWFVLLFQFIGSILGFLFYYSFYYIYNYHSKEKYPFLVFESKDKHKDLFLKNIFGCLIIALFFSLSYKPSLNINIVFSILITSIFIGYVIAISNKSFSFVLSPFIPLICLIYNLFYKNWDRKTKIISINNLIISSIIYFAIFSIVPIFVFVIFQ